MEFEVKKNKKKTILIVIAIILGVALITIGCIMYFKAKSGSGTDLIGDTKKEVTESVDENRNLQSEVLAIHEKYKDAIAWLKVPGTNIDTVVFKADNNDRYLRTNRDNVYDMWGETFMDYRCNIDNMTDKSHFIIYGHNTETDDHFTELLNYKDKEYFNNHQIIEMSTIKGNYRWQIFTVYVTDTDFFYIDTVFNDLDEYKTFLNDVKSKSMYNTNQDINEKDTILTLSTCDYTRTNGRFVVQAKLITD